MKFLLIDDHKVIREGLIRILLKNYPSASFEEASDAEEGISKLINTDFDVVITDLTMPGRNGLDFLKQVKKMKPDLPVLILSMHPEEHYAIRALKAGASGYLNKANGSEELLEALQRVAMGRKYISPAVAEKLTDDLHEKDEQPHEKLSDREFHIFKLLVDGQPLSDIAEQLSLSLSTVSTHRARILAKMKMKSNAELVKYALQHHLFS